MSFSSLSASFEGISSLLPSTDLFGFFGNIGKGAAGIFLMASVLKNVWTGDEIRDGRIRGPYASLAGRVTQLAMIATSGALIYDSGTCRIAMTAAGFLGSTLYARPTLILGFFVTAVGSVVVYERMKEGLSRCYHLAKEVVNHYHVPNPVNNNGN